MKIGLVCPYDFVFPGGVGRHVSSLYRHFTSMGHEVRVIAPTSRPVRDFGDLVAFLVRRADVGQTITLTVRRSGRTITVQALVTARPAANR